MGLRHLVLTSIVTLLLHSTLSEAAPLSKFKTYYKGRLELGAGLEYMTSNSNFGDTGGEKGLVSGAGYQIFRSPLAVRYGLGERWSLSSELLIATSTSKNTDASRNNSSLPEAKLGADALLYSGNFDFTSELQVIFPLERIEVAQDNALNSEGVMQVLAWLGLENRRNTFIWYGRGGFNYRMEGRSGLLLYEAGVGFRWPAFSLGAEIGGFQTLIDDADKGNELARYGLIQRVNGGSYSHYSVNPSVGEARVWSEFGFMAGMSMGALADWQGEILSFS